MQEPNAPVDESQATAMLQIRVRSRDLHALQRALDRISAVATDPAVFAEDQRDATIDDWTRDVLDVVTEGTVEVHCTFTPNTPDTDIPIPWRRARATPLVTSRVVDVASRQPAPAPAAASADSTAPTALPRVFFDVPALARAPGITESIDLTEPGGAATGVGPPANQAGPQQPPQPVEIVVAPESGDHPFVSETARNQPADVEADDRTDRRRLAMRGALGLAAVAIVILLAWLWPTTPSVSDAVETDAVEGAAEGRAIQTGATVTPAASADSPRGAADAEPPSRPVVVPAVAADEPAPLPPPPPSSPMPLPARPSAAAAPRETPPRAAPAAADEGSEAPQAFVGVLEITSHPTGAMVAVNSRAVGRTPLVLEDFPAGTHAVRIELAGFERWTKAIQVGTGQRASVDAILRASR